MAAASDNKIGYSGEEWAELKNFITEIVEKHTDTTFIDKMAKALHEDVLIKYKVLDFLKCLSLKTTI